MLIFVPVLHAQKFEGLALTPPMGWNSWNKFGCDVSEKLIKEIADALVASGMKDAGTKTCQGRPGSRGYEYQDARTYAEWSRQGSLTG
jgi:alpha-galactosidase